MVAISPIEMLLIHMNELGIAILYIAGKKIKNVLSAAREIKICYKRKMLTYFMTFNQEGNTR